MRYTNTHNSTTGLWLMLVKMHAEAAPILGIKSSSLLCGALAVFPPLCSPASAADYVDVKLVLATDVSGSINNDELWLERTGTATAFLDPNVITAIKGGALGRIAVTMLDFSSPGFGKTMIPWRIIQDAPSAAS